MAPENCRRWASYGPNPRIESISRGRASFWLSRRTAPSSTDRSNPQGPSAGETEVVIITRRPSEVDRLTRARLHERPEPEVGQLRPQNPHRELREQHRRRLLDEPAEETAVEVVRWRWET